MPAKVIFIAATVIVAAGIVVYENREQVFEFVDRTRRKVANSFRAFAEEVSSSPRERIALSSNVSYSGSTAYREDESEKRENEARAEAERSFSKEAEAYGFASSSRFYGENSSAAGGVRHRGPQFGVAPAPAPALDSVVFDAVTEAPSLLPSPPITPVKVFDIVSRRSSTETLQQEKPLPEIPPALPPKPQSLASPVSEVPPIFAAVPVLATLPVLAAAPIFTGAPTPALVPANPFTDAAVIQDIVIEAPAQPNATTSRTASSMEDIEENIPNPFENSQPYWSIHEWAENTVHTPVSPSLAGSAAEEIGQPADDIMSDFGSEDESVGSWTEIGSSVSGDDI